MSKYGDIFNKSISDRNGFWAEAAENIAWRKKWDKVLDDSNLPFYRWFTGGELNTCYNALDRHVENGRAGQTALIYDSPVTKRKIADGQSYTVPSTIDDPASLNEIETALKRIGYGVKT